MIDLTLVDIPSFNSRFSQYYQSLFEQKQALLREREARISGTRSHTAQFNYSYGLLCLASAIRASGFAVRYVAWNGHNLEEITKSAKVSRYFGVTSYSATIDDAAILCKIAKQTTPGLTTIVGGPHASHLDKQVLEQNPEIDLVVRGEGEYTLREILASPSDHLANVEGITYRGTDGTVIRNPPRQEVSDLGDLPLPAYDLLPRDIRDYFINISTSRGCPYRCRFCAEGTAGRKVRFEPLSHIEREIAFLNTQLPFGTTIYFSDSIFTMNRQRVVELCQWIKQQRIHLTFCCAVRHEFMDANLANEMSGANFIRFTVGLEDGNDSVLKLNAKLTTWADNLNLLSLLRENGRPFVTGYWITGLPGSTHESLQKNLEKIRLLIREDLVTEINNKVCVPYPGTSLYDDAEALGITILSQNWREYDRLSLPVHRLTTLSEYEIYSYFMLTEAVLLEEMRKREGETA